MPFALGGAALGAGTSLIGGGKQANATKQAAQTQANAANHATDLAHSQYEEQRADQQPWLQAGQNGLNLIQGNLSALTAGFDPTQQGLPAQFGQDASFHYDPTSFQQDPAFTSAMKMGQQAIERSAAARGNALGGATLKSLDQFGVDTANQFYNQDYARAQGAFADNYSRARTAYDDNYSHAFNTFSANQGNAFNRLSSLAGIGQTSVNQLGQAVQNYATTASNNALAAGNASSAGIIGAANATGNAWGTAAGTISNAFSNPNVSGYLKSKFGGSSYSGGGISDNAGNYLGE